MILNRNILIRSLACVTVIFLLACTGTPRREVLSETERNGIVVQLLKLPLLKLKTALIDTIIQKEIVPFWEQKNNRVMNTFEIYEGDNDLIFCEKEYNSAVDLEMEYVGIYKTSGLSFAVEKSATAYFESLDADTTITYSFYKENDDMLGFDDPYEWCFEIKGNSYIPDTLNPNFIN